MKRQPAYTCTNVNTLNIYSTYMQDGIKLNSHKKTEGCLSLVDTSLYDVRIGSSKHVVRVPQWELWKVSTIDYQLV